MAVKVKKPLYFHIVEYDHDVRSMILDRGHYVTDDVGKAQCVVFTGGEDVNPFLYGERTLRTTNINHKRDLYEIKLFKDLPYEVAKIGICRGGQLLNVLSGGRMWQHVGGHAGVDHTMKITALKAGDPERIITVNSVHHQQMIPGPMGDIRGVSRVAYEKINESAKFKINLEEIGWHDPEVIHYWTTNSLCFQPHPEYKDCPKECVEAFWAMAELVLPEDKAGA